MSSRSCPWIIIRLGPSEHIDNESPISSLIMTQVLVTSSYHGSSEAGSALIYPARSMPAHRHGGSFDSQLGAHGHHILPTASLQSGDVVKLKRPSAHELLCKKLNFER